MSSRDLGKCAQSDIWPSSHPRNDETLVIACHKQSNLRMGSEDQPGVCPSRSGMPIDWPLDQIVSPPQSGIVSLCKCVTPAGCASWTRSVCQPAAPPGCRKFTDLPNSLLKRSGHMTVTPGLPGTWGTWGWTSMTPKYSPNSFCSWGEISWSRKNTTLRSAINSPSSSFCGSVNRVSWSPCISVPICRVRWTTFVAALRRAFFSGSARLPGSICSLTSQPSFLCGNLGLINHSSWITIPEYTSDWVNLVEELWFFRSRRVSCEINTSFGKPFSCVDWELQAKRGKCSICLVSLGSCRCHVWFSIWAECFFLCHAGRACWGRGINSISSVEGMTPLHAQLYCEEDWFTNHASSRHMQGHWAIQGLKVTSHRTCPTGLFHSLVNTVSQCLSSALENRSHRSRSYSCRSSVFWSSPAQKLNSLLGDLQAYYNLE